jgi:hypothetical protein
VRPSSLPPSRQAEERWTVALSRTNRRRMTTVELVHGYASGAVSNDALIWKAGMEEWQSPFDIPALALALQARGFARPAVVPSAQREPQGGGTPLPPTSSAADWEGDDAPTRVADSSLRFPGRPQRGGATDERLAAETEGPKSDASVQVAQHWNEEDDEETVALGGNSSGGGSNGAASQKIVDFDDEATEVIAPDRARELLASESSKHPSLPAPPKLSAPIDEEDSTQIITESRAEALLAAQVAPRPSDAPPSSEGGPSAPLPRPAGVPVPLASMKGSGRAPPLPSRPPRQPPRPRPLTAEPNTPLDAASVPPVTEKPVIPTPKPAAGTPPLASLAPPKPSSAPPPGTTPVAPEPERSAEPTVVVAESSKPPRAPEAALVTLPRTRPPAPPGVSLRTMQNEPTRVVRVVSKGPGFAFWVVLVLALAAAAAGGFVVSQMLRDRAAPSWLRRP